MITRAEIKTNFAKSPLANEIVYTAILNIEEQARVPATRTIDGDGSDRIQAELRTKILDRLYDGVRDDLVALHKLIPYKSDGDNTLIDELNKIIARIS